MLEQLRAQVAPRGRLRVAPAVVLGQHVVGLGLARRVAGSIRKSSSSTPTVGPAMADGGWRMAARLACRLLASSGARTRDRFTSGGRGASGGRWRRAYPPLDAVAAGAGSSLGGM